MRKRSSFIIAAIAGLVIFGSPDGSAKDIDFSGMLRSYTGSRVEEEDIPLTEQTVDLTLESWGDMSEILINPYAYISEEGEVDMGFSEAYIDFFFSRMDLRLGQQAVVWGQAEGAFITDIVSPQDLRSFILADFSEIRKGIPAVKGNYYAGPFTLETVWIPRFVPATGPDADSIWYTPEMAVTESEALPDSTLENSEIFGKISYFGAAVDAEIMAGYAWDDYPVLEGSLSAPESQYYRYMVTGGSFSTTLGPVVIRGETAFYLDREFSLPVSEDSGPELIPESYNQIHGLIGLDWSLMGVDMSAQYIHQQIPDYDESLLTEEMTQTVTFRMRDSYFSDTLSWELFTYLEILEPDDFTLDALIRPSVIYSIEEGVEFKTGMEIFSGDNTGRFGRYEDNTLAYVSVSWYF